MIENRQQRRLTTILSADVVGYSRLVADDEPGTVQALSDILNTVFPQVAAPFRGRSVKLMGDGILMEFQSVVDAVNCAVALQSRVAARQASRPERDRIGFRIGINVGDVIVEGDDIFGTGVNVAARIEALADAGGIFVSRAVHDQVRDIVPHRFEYLGRKRVKNLPHPIEIYRLVAPGAAEETETTPRPRSARPGSALVVAGIAALLVLLLAVASVSLLRPGPAAMAPAANTSSPHRTSIAVLRFRDMSVQASQDHLADAILDELISGLSRNADLEVVSSGRKAYIDYRMTGAPARDRTARYVLDGSIQRAGPAFRVIVQIVDPWTGVHVWAQRFSGDAGNLFDLQDRIVVNTVAAVRLLLVNQSAR